MHVENLICENINYFINKQQLFKIDVDISDKESFFDCYEEISYSQCMIKYIKKPFGLYY